MADTFIDDLDWVTDELITSTKFNQWWANMQNFHNGTALGDGIIVTRHYDDASVTADKLSTGADSAVVATAQSTTSTSYTDLATVGPEITVDVGANGMLLVGMYANMNHADANEICNMSFVLSGANTQAASDSFCLSHVIHSAGGPERRSAIFLLKGLSTGSTTITAKYKANTPGTANFSDRRIFAIPL